jgi:acetyl-CoA acetyltransferase family protein
VREVVIVGAGRSATGRRNGTLAETNATELGSQVLRSVLKKSNVDPQEVEFIVGGCITQAGEQSHNVARGVGLMAGLPIEVPAVTVDFQCGSSQQALQLTVDMIGAGTADVAAAIGVETMSRVPMGANYANGPNRPFNRKMVKQFEITTQGHAAENIATEWGITRRDADEFGARSHQLAGHAREMGWFKEEIVPVHVERDGQELDFDNDETIRMETTAEALASLEPSFKEDGIHHAGNSSLICDQASAVILATREKAEDLGLTPRARIVAHASVGSDPHLMLTGPITATPKVLQRAGLSMDDIDAFEINEAFASVVLAWAKEVKPDMDKVNPNGGAIALGHALGSTGTRLMTTLLHHLERTDSRYGLETMCCGGGMATATVIERL